jgi:hypothetical protein
MSCPLPEKCSCSCGLGRLSTESNTRPFGTAMDKSWNNKTGSWGGVPGVDEKQWIYKDDQAVVVTTIQPSRDVWREEEMKKVIPKLRHLKVRN